MLIKLFLKGDSSSHKGLQTQHMTSGLSCKRLAIFLFIYLLFLIITTFEFQATWLFFLLIYPNLIRCSRCSWKRNLEKIFLLYSILQWHSFKRKTSIWWDAACRSFPEFPDTSFFHCICTYIYSLIHIYTHFKLLFLSTWFFFS